MDLVDVVGLAGVPVIVAIIEAFKLFYSEEKRLYPIIAVAVGLALNLGVAFPYGDIRQAIVYGIVAGLAAVGLYSGTRNMAGK